MSDYWARQGKVKKLLEEMHSLSLAVTVGSTELGRDMRTQVLIEAAILAGAVALEISHDNNGTEEES